MATPTKPGIYLRGGIKTSFDDAENAIQDREIVMATDTGEIGTANGWFDPFTPIEVSGRIGQIYSEYDATTRTFSTAWGIGMVWTPRAFSGGSRIKVDWRCPFRNDSNSWGGGYIDIEYSYDGITWVTVGHSGYDGSVMNSGSPSIGSMNGTFYLLNCPSTNFTLHTRFKHKSYDGTVTINGSHDIATGTLGAFWANMMFMEILS